jgi:hypothetical protein
MTNEDRTRYWIDGVRACFVEVVFLDINYLSIMLEGRHYV